MYQFLLAFLLGLICLACESILSPKYQAETERSILDLRGPVSSLSIFRASLEKKGKEWEPQEETRVSVEQFDRQGNLTERLAYNADGSLHERAVFSYNTEENAREEQRFDAGSRLLQRIVSVYDGQGRIAESRLYSANVLTERVAFQRDPRGKEIASHTYQPQGELKGRTSTSYDDKKNIEQQLWHDADDVLRKKMDYHRDFQGTLVTRVAFVYSANAQLRERTDVHFNNNGDPTEQIVYEDDGRTQQREMFSYRYDAFGNWTTQTVKRQVVNKNASYFAPTQIIFRVFEYYERG